MKRPCHAAHAPSPETCGICERIATRPEYAALWSDGPPAAQLAPCRHLGAPTGEARDCGRCGGAKAVPLRACAARGVCTTDRLLDGVPFCRVCRIKGEGYEPAPRDPPALLTGGIGDVFTIDSFTRPEVRQALTRLTLACPAAGAITQLYQAVPTYPRLAKYDVLPSGGRVFYQRSEVAKRFPRVGSCEDWSILARFPAWEHSRAYAGSSFLEHRLCRARAIDRPYAVVVPHSNWGWWANRAFDADDWRECLGWLERAGLLGVVLHRGGDRDEKVPDDPRLLDLTNQTSILESVELLKGAAGYAGIDSALSVLAVKLFTPDTLAIKCVQDHCYRWAFLYYAPWATFPFLTRRLVAPDRR